MDNELKVMDEEIEETEDEEIEETEESSGIGTGLAMLIGSGLTLAGIAIGKKVKKVWAKRKAEKGIVDVEIVDVVEETEDVEPGEQTADEKTKK